MSLGPPMKALELGVDALAVYRMTKFIIDDELLADLREKITDRYPPDSTKLGYLVGCPWCVSIYMGTAAVARPDLLPQAVGGGVARARLLRGHRDGLRASLTLRWLGVSCPLFRDTV